MIESNSKLNKLIHYKGIIHERAEDAPFMGALVIATSCHNNCQGCFNQHLKDAKTYERYADEVITEVKQDVFNDGVILGGLEWSEQPEETIALINSAKKTGLQVMLYSGLDENELLNRIPVEHLHGCYIKVGRYIYSEHSDDYVSNGVRLASTNQYVKCIP